MFGPYLALALLLVLTPIRRAQEDEDDKRREAAMREEIVSNATVLETYEAAVQAYLDEDWDACIQGFRDMMHKYKNYRNMVIKCRRKCRTEMDEGFSPLYRENIEDLHFYEKKVKETLCLLQCNQEYRDLAGKRALQRLPKKTEYKIMMQQHYEYLHGCYYQKKYYQEAANAVFTYLIYNPTHKASQASLAYYMGLPQVNNETVRNLEVQPFFKDYVSGVTAYENEYYEEAVEKLEFSLKSFFEAEEQCRFYCEGPFDQGWSPEFTTAVSNHFVFDLHCKRRCSRVLSTLNGDYRADFLVNHFNYLQFAYYKLGDLRKACETVETFLLFFPSDDTMLANKEFYASLPIVDEDYFTPRQDVVSYVKRQEYEKLLLRYIAEEFNAFEDKVEASESKSKDDTDVNEIKVFLLNHYIGVATNATLPKINAITDKYDLGDDSRFLVEGLINQADCESIIRIAEMTSWEGDGYENNQSPHSEFERFEGVTIGRLAMLAYYGILEPELLKLILRVTETVRQETQRIVKVNQQLYITYTHLVCRTALPGSPVNRSDYSHRIHADNCLAQNDGSCLSESPAYVHRDYSSILYLNDNFQGGDFIFVKDKNASTIESTIRPRCGRMLSFSSGSRNLHGVTAVTQGKRCALGIWFTLQADFEDLDRDLAEAVLEKIQLDGTEKLTESLTDAESYHRHKRMLIRRLLKRIV
ncbi:prolyl 3-hydroxylase 2 [Nasonia vitripennis]|uniref:procollagen-proline 3-dioxygenase n=1 Tax=Nasonia vitripennis TaxID=7425 RepID=A0A7M7M297_NASVI|nr:prolyl 3-hydroxylase 2 [Nasonia vitripennis]